jgi:hypothetical protein
MKTCADRQNLMLEYLYDLLDDAECRDLQGHADGCPSCATALRQAQVQKGQLAAAAKREFPNVRFVAPAESQPATLPFRRAIIKHPWVRYALAASVLIAIGVTVVARNPWWKNGATSVANLDGKENKNNGPTIGPLVLPDSPLDVKDAGLAVGPLQASITLDQDTFKLGAPRILVRYQIQNVSKEPVFIWHRNFWPNHEIVVVDEKGVPVLRTPLGEGYLKQFAWEAEKPLEPSAQRAELLGSKSDSTYGAQNLAMFFKFEKPGKYHVQIKHKEYHPDAWTGELSSNILHFDIVP